VPASFRIPLLVEKSGSAEETSPCEGLTIIMACRSVKRATIARGKLMNLLEAEIENQKTMPDYDGHAESFLRNLTIEVHCLDLAVMKSIFEFCDILSARRVYHHKHFSGSQLLVHYRYPYVSHLICNAGIANIIGLDFFKMIWQGATDFIAAVSTPTYKIQQYGEISVDGLGLVWQSNVFGHFALVHFCTSLFSFLSLNYI
jgi:3-keto steroid reductase